MASACISSCVDDARVPVRATYVNLYKWPESDFEFVRSMSSKSQSSRHGGQCQPRVVDRISCRQMYLRSYTFSREEDHTHDDSATIKCLGRGQDHSGKKKKKTTASAAPRRRGDNSAGFKKAKSVSCSALAYIFRRLLSCTTDVDVAN